MNQRTWLNGNCTSLKGKTAAITGPTGGLGLPICKGILYLGGSLILLGRNPQKLQAMKEALLRQYPEARIRILPLDLGDLKSVKQCCEALQSLPLDILIHNAGIYRVPRFRCSTGLDNIFQVNFASPYYMTLQLLPTLQKRQGRVVAVGSVAHGYSHIDPEDPDFSTRKQSPLVYGNSKRFLMYGLWELLKDNPDVSCSIGHPGITVTNISAHYPRPIWALLKYPMKLIFMGNTRAVRGILLAVCHPLPPFTWAGPRYFHIWGNPKAEAVTSCSCAERCEIAQISQKLYRRMTSCKD